MKRTSIFLKVLESGSAVLEPEKVHYLTIVLIVNMIIIMWFVLKLAIKK